MPSVPRRPDVVGVFDSDEHRRVAAACVGLTLDDLARHLYKETAINIWEGAPGDHGEVESLLGDLEADGLVKADKDGCWELTKKGYETLQAPGENVPPPMDPETARKQLSDYVAQEKARVDQHREHLKEIHAGNQAALDENNASLDNYEKELEKLLENAVPDAKE